MPPTAPGRSTATPAEASADRARGTYLPATRGARVTPAIFASAFSPHLGGVEELVRQLSIEQRSRGTGTVVVTHRWPRDLAPREVVDGIPVLRERLRFPGSGWRSWAGFLAHSLRVSSQLHRELLAAGTEVVHVQCVSNNGLYALWAARRLGLPLVVSLQGELTMDASGIYQRNRYLRWTWRQLLIHADVVTACSADSLREAQEAFSRPFGTRARVVHNGICLADFEGVTPEVRPRPYVLGLGRLVRQKGMDLLLRAFVGIEPGHDLVIAGEGPERTTLQELVVELGLSDRVHFLGGVDHDRALRLFAGADVFVLPSRHEPQGIVVLEAMASGTPVLAARVGGVPEVVTDGQTGLLFRGSDPADLHQGLQRLLQSSELRLQLAREGKQRAQAFSWSHIADQYEQCYQQARTRVAC